MRAILEEKGHPGGKADRPMQRNRPRGLCPEGLSEAGVVPSFPANDHSYQTICCECFQRLPVRVRTSGSACRTLYWRRWSSALWGRIGILPHKVESDRLHYTAWCYARSSEACPCRCSAPIGPSRAVTTVACWRRRLTIALPSSSSPESTQIGLAVRAAASTSVNGVYISAIIDVNMHRIAEVRST